MYIYIYIYIYMYTHIIIIHIIIIIIIIIIMNIIICTRSCAHLAVRALANAIAAIIQMASSGSRA